MVGTHFVIFLVAGLVMLFAVHALMLVWALKWWRLHAQETFRIVELSEEEGGSLSAEQVGELPCHKCKKGAPGGGECVVCLEAFRLGEQRRVLLGCEHGFHAEWVDLWLRKSRRCPISRADMVACKNVSEVEEPTAVEIVTQR
ncbi:RING-H2 finger protein ATL56 [Setaria viridis]|uniref:RING-type domain-containing protein n=1 Tax=Setaria viridis TaxID=4556 RepID=A0A4U6WF44_SETVI|nr:RING-H2 finger protein ATL56-like [Setaria viridis]TKW41401.1 hypothetical protein SEVIR_1G312600v2 [Setaria viridis]